MSYPLPLLLACNFKPHVCVEQKHEMVYTQANLFVLIQFSFPMFFCLPITNSNIIRFGKHQSHTQVALHSVETKVKETVFCKYKKMIHFLPFWNTLVLLAASYICPRCSHLVWVFVTHRSEFIKAVVTAWVSYWGVSNSKQGEKRSSFSQSAQRWAYLHVLTPFLLLKLLLRIVSHKKTRNSSKGMRDKR